MPVPKDPIAYQKYCKKMSRIMKRIRKTEKLLGIVRKGGGWSKGLTKETDSRVLQISISSTEEKVRHVCQRKECGKVFYTHANPSDRSAKFCSRECYLKEHGKKVLTTKCLTCGIEFRFSKSEDRQYCSRKCYLEKHKADLIEVECEYCKKKFQTVLYDGTISRFCSRNCYAKCGIYISNPQKKLFEVAKSIWKDVEMNHYIKTPLAGRHHCIADMCISRLKVVIEYDEPYWHSASKDAERDKSLVAAGYSVLHFVATVPSQKILRQGVRQVRKKRVLYL